MYLLLSLEAQTLVSTRVSIFPNQGCLSKMVAARQQVAILANLLPILDQTSLLARQAFVAAYKHQLFLHLGTSTAQRKWWTF